MQYYDVTEISNLNKVIFSNTELPLSVFTNSLPYQFMSQKKKKNIF